MSKKEYILEKLSTRAPKDFNKDKIKLKTLQLTAELNELQNLMYAGGKHSLLIILQGLDASGKGGTVRKVFKAVNPAGVYVKSFKAPTELELKHDFLWRIHQNVPEKGMIQIFDRSHYEDVLVTRVLKLIDDKTAHKRFKMINEFEKLLETNHTHIIKFYLHISEKQQKERFEERLDDPRKNWKYNPNDLKTAKNWPAYRKYYQEVFDECSKDIPWVIVPSDQNWYKQYIVAKTIVEKLKNLNMKYPKYKAEK